MILQGQNHAEIASATGCAAVSVSRRAALNQAIKSFPTASRRKQILHSDEKVNYTFQENVNVLHS